MRISVITLVAFVFAVIGFDASAQSSSKNSAYIVAVPDTVNLGEITVSDISDNLGRISFDIKNDGVKPLIVNDVQGCCGTNVTEWPKAPILPGKTGTVKVFFRVEPRPQAISRTVTIRSNASNNPALKVHIVGVVFENARSGEIKL
ncbi:MAG: DUF1573 domain-containing protein [Bacteroidales bacterium]|nr:DUF1573 domain-containing protein [Bacteroidales bacterium]MBN2748755.1 DUF1573 domain-containing protein [Bacteroidales bacterium]